MRITKLDLESTLSRITCGVGSYGLKAVRNRKYGQIDNYLINEEKRKKLMLFQFALLEVEMFSDGDTTGFDNFVSDEQIEKLIEMSKKTLEGCGC